VSFGLAILRREERLNQVPRDRWADRPTAHAQDARFVLLKCTTLCNWQRVATNFATPSSFPIGGVGTEASAFYAIVSE
jgi:hypothetical protein